MVRNIIVITILGIAALFFLTSCRYAEIIDIIHKETEKVSIYEGINFSDKILKKYQVQDVLFIPYLRHLPFSSYDQEYYFFSLRLDTYKLKKNNCVIIINNVIIETVDNIEFEMEKVTLNKILKFNDSERNKDIEESTIILVEKLNDHNMELNKDSVLKVTLNVTVDNGNKLTEDIEYYFETNIRKYYVQR